VGEVGVIWVLPVTSGSAEHWLAAEADAVEQSVVDRLRDLGLSEGDVADVVFTVAARCFFTRVLDGLGAQLDVETASTFARRSSPRWWSDGLRAEVSTTGSATGYRRLR
jgi:hypothetical protein